MWFSTVTTNWYCQSWLCWFVHTGYVFIQFPPTGIVLLYVLNCSLTLSFCTASADWYCILYCIVLICPFLFFFSFCVVTADWFCTSMFRYSLAFVSHVLIVHPDGTFLQLLLIDSVWFTCSDFSPDGAFLQLPLIDSVCFTCSDFLTRWRFCPLRSIDIMFHMCCFLSRDCGFAQFQQINVILSQ